MSVPELSTGSMQLIMSGSDYDKPVLQILGSKKIQGGESERYRLLVSDGVYLNSFAMLATQLNNLCEDGKLSEFTIIRLDRYITSMVNKSEKGDKRVLIILDLTVLKKGSEVGKRIGNPTVVIAGDSNNKPAPEASTSGPISSFTKPESRSSNEQSQTQYNNGSQRNLLNRELTYPIASLSPYQNKWVIKARVTFKSGIRTWSNAKGEGKLFSMDLMDESGEIRATAFKEQCDKFYDMIEVDRVYFISKCQLKPANKQYTSIKNDYEMTLTMDTAIELCEDEEVESSIPQVKYDFVPISKIADIEPKSTVDIIGICRDVAELQSFTSRTTNKELTKRELTLIDKSDAAVQLTLWGDDAVKFDENFGNTQPVILIKNARVTEFNGGKSLSMGNGTIMKVNPDITEGHQLRGWYDNGGGTNITNSISARTGGGSFATEWLTFREAQEKNLGAGDKPDYFQCKAIVHTVKAANAAYKACPQDNCNKKVVEESNEHYRCEKCQAVYPNYKWRLLLYLNIGDWTGDRYVTCFSEVAEQLLGQSAQEVGTILEEKKDEASFKEVFAHIHYRSFVFKLRSKFEVYSDVNRNKLTAMSVAPVNYREYNKHLISNLERMTGIGKA